MKPALFTGIGLLVSAVAAPGAASAAAQTQPAQDMLVAAPPIVVFVAEADRPPPRPDADEPELDRPQRPGQPAPPNRPAQPQPPQPPGGPNAPEPFVRPEAPESPEMAGAWLGLQLGPVPAALAAHLPSGDKGLMVRNLFKDSPADKAGIERYDVLISADDQPIPPDVRAFRESIRGKKPGDEVHLTLLRKAREMHLSIALAEPPPSGQLEPKFPEDPDVLLQRNFGLRGKILRPRPQGGWSMEDLGEMPEIQRFFGLERGEGAPAKAMEAHRRFKDGHTLDVKRLPDGKVEVRRTPPGAPRDKGEVKTYANADDLGKLDAEAAELLKKAGEEPRGMRNLPPRPGEVGPQWQEWRDRFFQGPLRAPLVRPAVPSPAAEPSVRFDVQPDGSITVHSREKDAELNMTFKNREAFKDRAPELYKRFEDMQKSVK